MLRCDVFSFAAWRRRLAKKQMEILPRKSENKINDIKKTQLRSEQNKFFEEISSSRCEKLVHSLFCFHTYP